MSKKYTTLKDIAKYLGLHHTTISKALRNHPDINEKTRELIQKTAQELDYHPSAIARSFKNNRSSVVGICVPLINLNFFANVICGAETVLDKAGFTIMVCQAHEDYAREIKATSALISNHVAGLLISPSQTTKDVGHLESFKRRGIPVVCFDRTVEGSDIDSVVVNDREAAFDLVSHMIKSGREKIAHLAGPQNVSVAKDRMQGYLDALKHHKIPVESKRIIEGTIDYQAGVSGLLRLLDEKQDIDGVFAVNDMVAFGAHRAISSRDLSIPKDIALAGFGDLELSQFLNPPLTTVRQSPTEMGEIAAELVLKKILKPSPKQPPTKKVLSAELVIRESTARK